MSMRKKQDQKRFMRKCVDISGEFKQISALGYHGIINWGEFLEKFVHAVERMRKMFEEEGL